MSPHVLPALQCIKFRKEHVNYEDACYRNAILGINILKLGNFLLNYVQFRHKLWSCTNVWENSVKHIYGNWLS